MTKIAIKDILIKERQRKEVSSKDFETHVVDLAHSIKTYGLLNPITINKDDSSLVAGFCRLMAMARLGYEEVECRFKEDLSEIEQQEIELEENIRRKNLEWFEEAAAIAKIHELKSQSDPDWNISKTSALVGKSRGSVSESITVSKEIEKNPELKKEKGSTSAVRKVQTERKLQRRSAAIAAARDKRDFRAEILQGDARELIRESPDESFDAVVTNFPFGVNLELKSEGRKENLEIYEDDETLITDLIMEMVPEIFRVLKDESWFIGLFDIRKIMYNRFTKELLNYKKPTGERAMGLKWWLEQAGFSYVSRIPFIWVKPNKTQGIIGNPAKGMITSYEAGVFASKGDATLLKQGRQNVFVHDSPPAGDKVHPLQMPVSLCRELLDMIVLGGGKVLDPFAGSGSFGVAALDKECEFVGFELDETLCRDGNTRLSEHELKKEDE